MYSYAVRSLGRMPVGVCHNDENVLPGFIDEALFPLSLLRLLDEIANRRLGGRRSALITRSAFERSIRVIARFDFCS